MGRRVCGGEEVSRSQAESALERGPPRKRWDFGCRDMVHRQERLSRGEAALAALSRPLLSCMCPAAASRLRPTCRTLPTPRQTPISRQGNPLLVCLGRSVDQLQVHSARFFRRSRRGRGRVHLFTRHLCDLSPFCPHGSHVLPETNVVSPQTRYTVPERQRLAKMQGERPPLWIQRRMYIIGVLTYLINCPGCLHGGSPFFNQGAPPGCPLGGTVLSTENRKVTMTCSLAQTAR